MLRTNAKRVLFGLALVGGALIGAACSSDDEGSARGATDASAGGSSAGSGGEGTAGGGGSGASTSTDCDCALGLYRGACGVDGVTYDATCGVECVPVEVACMNECPCPAAPGEYMGTCAGDGGLECNGDLVCVQWFEFSGGSGSGGRVCTQPCTLGCPAPSPGCGSDDRCAHP